MLKSISDLEFYFVVGGLPPIAIMHGQFQLIEIYSDFLTEHRL